MKDFRDIIFHGTFRDYQAKVLKGANKHIQDGKVNIVAAPGSGKTILGLELIRKLDAPCLIFSPTVTIRDQWGSRFKDFFLENDQKFEDYFSTDLNNLKLITSITYQALYSAMKKIKCEDDEEIVDYSTVDMFKLVNDAGIKTICLDEAHHLQNEWQKALESFVGSLRNEVKIISLTATPPYDASEVEWQRYESICGPIDEEIFVPELVKTNTLCPHQDYVYLNFPTENEIKDFQGYKKKANLAVDEFLNLAFVKDIAQQLNDNFETEYDELFSFAKEYIALLIVFNHAGVKINKKLIKVLTGRKHLPSYNLNFAEIAINFLISSEKLTEAQKKQIKDIFKKNSLMERGNIRLDLNDKLRKKLVSSMGKLHSIEKIVECESSSLNDKLRMLILTDYIKKENIDDIGTSNNFSSISIVSIFETIRRKFPDIKIGVLSGSLVILPTYIKDLLSKTKTVEKGFTSKEISGTEFSIFNFKGSNKDKVSIVGGLFSDGELNVLVGTKSLLGEGWDSPCINSLILASFVGSFMLSNQMRGRAIRIDKKNPDKVSNIWHLVSIEPEYFNEENKAGKGKNKANEQSSSSCDFETLKRRFSCFVAPNYSTGEIESGIERITAIKPPFTQQGIDHINSTMMNIAVNREKLSNIWKEETFKSKNNNVRVVTSAPRETQVKGVLLQNLLAMTGICLVLFALGSLLIIDLIVNFSITILIIFLVIALISIIFGAKIFKKIMAHITPLRSLKTLCNCILKTLKLMGVIKTECYLKIKTAKKKSLTYEIELIKASRKEDNDFNIAIKELLSPIKNPRYILIRKGMFGYQYLLSFACPSIIGQNKENVKILEKKMATVFGRMEVVYTRNEKGREFILKCRKRSYISKNEHLVNNKYRLSNLE